VEKKGRKNPEPATGLRKRAVPPWRPTPKKKEERGKKHLLERAGKKETVIRSDKKAGKRGGTRVSQKKRKRTVIMREEEKGIKGSKKRKIESLVGETRRGCGTTRPGSFKGKKEASKKGNQKKRDK